LKKILLISDTHSYLDPKLGKYIDDCDEVWHGGDIGSVEVSKEISAKKTFRAVFGNIDGNDLRALFPENLCFDCEEVKVLITHIAGYPGKYPARVKNLIKELKPKLFICGHSHILKVMYDKENELLYMNPGACGNSGFHQIKTALRFQIDKAEIKNLEIIELGKRSAQ
jgi:putative phosphoesterase